ncbi:GNAT family N-acetyltransferase [Streptomyces sp. NPDC048383]|uniref:GNAT family N-acetyltransferase n=1 Tax=Streptomyces sp. NPDC048383 TaxID=3155386 RepID=UPI0034473526
MPNPLVRALDLADEATAASVHRIGRASYAVEADLIGFDGIPALRESLREMRERPLHWLGAVSDDGSIAGFLAWAPEYDAVIGVDRLCVDPTWFRRGIAARLMRHLLTEAFPDRTVEVCTGAANAPAVALYEGLGMVRGADFSPVPDLLMAQFTRPAP